MGRMEEEEREEDEEDEKDEEECKLVRKKGGPEWGVKGRRSNKRQSVY